MTCCYKQLLAALTLGFFSISVSANDKDKKIPPLLVNDTLSVYQELLIDDSEDLMENHPAGDIYNNIWTQCFLWWREMRTCPSLTYARRLTHWQVLLKISRHVV